MASIWMNFFIRSQIWCRLALQKGWKTPDLSFGSKIEKMSICRSNPYGVLKAITRQVLIVVYNMQRVACRERPRLQTFWRTFLDPRPRCRANGRFWPNRPFADFGSHLRNHEFCSDFDKNWYLGVVWCNKYDGVVRSDVEPILKITIWCF